MRLIDAEALKGKKIYSEERHEYVIPVFDIDNAPTVDAAPKWISVEDRLPDELPKNLKSGWSESVRPSEYVLCMTRDDVFKAFYSYSYSDWTRHDESKSYSSVTHWIPLPQPPKMDKEDGEE